MTVPRNALKGRFVVLNGHIDLFCPRTALRKQVPSFRRQPRQYNPACLAAFAAQPVVACRTCGEIWLADGCSVLARATSTNEMLSCYRVCDCIYVT